MTTFSITTTFPYPIELVWETVTSLENYTWRTDLSKIEIIEKGKQFIEYTNKGFRTTFTITAFELMKKYEFDMENNRMKGHWIGIFWADADNTTICFTEYIQVKTIFLKPFIRIFARLQQKRYISDLQNRLR